MTMMAGWSISRRWPYIRASLIAASLASQPELQKKTSSMSANATSRSDNISCSRTR